MEGKKIIPRSSQQSGPTSFLYLVYRNMSGKQVSGIYVPDAKRENFPVDSPDDIQSRCVIPRIHRGIKVHSQCYMTEAHYKFAEKRWNANSQHNFPTYFLQPLS